MGESNPVQSVSFNKVSLLGTKRKRQRGLGSLCFCVGAVNHLDGEDVFQRDFIRYQKWSDRGGTFLFFKDTIYRGVFYIPIGVLPQWQAVGLFLPFWECFCSFAFWFHYFSEKFLCHIFVQYIALGCSIFAETILYKLPKETSEYCDRLFTSVILL